MDHNDIRKMFAEGDNARDAGLTTPEGIVRYDDISYGPHGKWNLLDVYRPVEAGDDLLPVIVSVHGGGWVYGDKDRYQFYCMDLARRGFAVVNFSYRLAPENRFPAAVEDVNSLFWWLLNHGAEYHMDLGQLFTVGDSAGGQLSSQYIAMLTDPAYAAMYSFPVPAGKIRVKGAAFNCAEYQFEVNDPNPRSLMTMENYFGEEWRQLALLANTLEHITPDFPPSFIMTSYYDFLREQAPPMCRLLEARGIPYEYRLYGAEGDQYMGHVFHLNIRLKEAEICNDEECAFFRSLM